MHLKSLQLPASVQLVECPGLPTILRVDAETAIGELSLNGAHVMSWARAGHGPVLWMSRASRFASGEPIRGGIPICFPWFNRHPEFPDAPQHGFARISPWSVIDAAEEGGEVSITLRLTDSPATRASIWPHRFEATYTVTFGASLRLSLEVANTDAAEFRFEEALHTYFAIGDARRTVVSGLEGAEFSEPESQDLRRDPLPVVVGNGVSRRYPRAAGGVIHDRANGRVMRVASEGASGAILWNPGAEVATSLDDFDDDWAGMVCLETCNLQPGEVTLRPGERHRMQATVTLAESSA